MIGATWLPENTFGVAIRYAGMVLYPSNFKSFALNLYYLVTDNISNERSWGL